MKLSVIIPAFNVAEYIGECLDSVVNQTYRDLEIIVVNDGSTDNTGEIIGRYKEDNRIIVIDKSNGGLSDARNAGIARATGDLITFLDGDDCLSNDCYELNVGYFTEDAALDMVQFPVMFDWQSDHQYLRKPESRIIQGNDVFALWWKNDQLIYSAWNKIYRREIFRKVTYPKGKCFEDMYIVPDLAKKIKKVVVSESGVYYYRYRPGSILNSILSYGKHRDQLDAMMRIYDESRHYSSLKKERAEFWINIIWWQLYSLHHYSKEEQMSSIRAFQQYPLSMGDFISGRLSVKNRVRIITLKALVFPNLFWLFQLLKKLKGESV
ncbi:MAG: glycosyltransferase family 2 protein [Bacteroidota bacterium]|nr:glycosyltransferase family 2 protein [Bacteroidota bacterium]